MAVPHHTYIQMKAATCIWKTWIWLSFLLECLMAWNICANFICRATNWEHFQKVFFGISAAWANSTCRTMVWRNCPAVSARETIWMWYFPSSGSFRGLCQEFRKTVLLEVEFEWIWKVPKRCRRVWQVLEGLAVFKMLTRGLKRCHPAVGDINLFFAADDFGPLLSASI